MSTDDNSPSPPPPRDDEDPFRKVRLEKLESLRGMGIDPYPVSFARNDIAADIERRHADLPGWHRHRRAGAGRRAHSGDPQQRHVYRLA